MYHIAFDELPWEIAPSGARFKIHKSGDRQLRLLEFGQDLLHPDWCTTGHIGYVLKGQMEVEFDHGVILFGEGDGLSIPPGEKDRHRPKAISEKIRLIFIEDI